MATSSALSALAARSRGLNSLYGVGGGKKPVPTPAGSDYVTGGPVSGGPVSGDPYAAGDAAAARQLVMQNFVSPEIAAIRTAIEQRAHSGMSAIAGLTNALQEKLAPFAGQIGGIYGDAEGRQAAVDSALQGALTGAGGSAADSLSSRLASANLPNTGALAADTAARGAAAGTTELAKGSATLASLIGQGASAQEYASKQPGVAGAQGLQFGRELQGQLNDELASQTNTINSRVPSLVSSTLAQIEKQRIDSVALRQRQTAADFLNWYRDQQLGLRNKQIDQSGRVADANNQTRITIAQARLAEASRQADRRIEIQQQNANTSAYRATHTSADQPPRLTAKEIQDYKGASAKIADRAFNGFTPPPTTANPNPKPLPPATYQQAINVARQEGVPLDIAIPYLNMYYQPGQRGRPAAPKTATVTHVDAKGP